MSPDTAYDSFCHYPGTQICMKSRCFYLYDMLYKKPMMFWIFFKIFVCARSWRSTTGFWVCSTTANPALVIWCLPIKATCNVKARQFHVVPNTVIRPWWSHHAVNTVLNLAVVKLLLKIELEYKIGYSWHLWHDPRVLYASLKIILKFPWIVITNVAHSGEFRHNAPEIKSDKELIENKQSDMF